MLLIKLICSWEIWELYCTLNCGLETLDSQSKLLLTSKNPQTGINHSIILCHVITELVNAWFQKSTSRGLLFSSARTSQDEELQGISTSLNEREASFEHQILTKNVDIIERGVVNVYWFQASMTSILTHVANIWNQFYCEYAPEIKRITIHDPDINLTKDSCVNSDRHSQLHSMRSGKY